jgi:hypothetical protein
MKKALLLTSVICSLAPIGVAFADDDNNDNNNGLQAVPFTFVGKAGDCGTAAGSNIITSAWLTGLGLPDNGGSNTVAADTAAKRDPHLGLLLSKNGPTTDCSSAGATIEGAAGITFSTTTELGFDYRNGTHCGAGAPRFNIVTSDNVTHFAGCAAGTITPAPQDPAEWTRVRMVLTNPAQTFPPVVPGTKIKSLSIIFDEGTDVTGTEDPRGVGLAVLDNIDVNGVLITRGSNNNGNGKDNGDKNDN